MVYSIKSTNDFDKQLRGAGNKIVLVDFYANWCGPCKMIEPTINSLEQKYGEQVLIMKVNVDKFSAVADYYKVSSLPTFLFFKNGKRLSGFSGADEFKLQHKMAALVKS